MGLFDVADIASFGAALHPGRDVGQHLTQDSMVRLCGSLLESQSQVADCRPVCLDRLGHQRDGAVERLTLRQVEHGVVEIYPRWPLPIVSALDRMAATDHHEARPSDGSPRYRDHDVHVIARVRHELP